jgi:putative ATP-dependent endonuclease of the OLD family
LLGGDESNLFPSGVLWGDNLVIWPSDLADIAKREFIVSLGPQGEAQFETIESHARGDAGDAGGLSNNSVYIGYLLERLHAANAKSASLDLLCGKILQTSMPATVPTA